MIDTGIRELLASVLTSWEVIAVSIVLILYFFLVFYVARLYRRPKSFNPFMKARKAHKPKAAPVEDVPVSDEDEDFID